MIKAKLEFPASEKRILWAGIYQEYSSGIIFFKKKPEPSKQDGIIIYDPLLNTNKDNIAGCMDLDIFRKLYPNIKLPETKYHKDQNKNYITEITEIFQIELEWYYDKHGLVSIDGHFDGF